ncbi:type I DNA topoisomerase [Qipengyuania flava]|uniref:type I DNA topoisomerase n=1 Tax=Qipengyuania flava TaxID=192812 RepID=UPI001C59D16B|nr:type I DNA topoisomerase [Qipengyuania flava]MBW3168845.1 type I DNA topoisomerase [Qipengyuania flava]MBY5966083.1 type I DNA topoisomerase [Qipengyuania flava]MBY6012407.1 type I DNA topoisomerase [Qipengyuania flava]MBY6026849.1 type I DNA topoisomerase [Qipengyuania flava]
MQLVIVESPAKAKTIEKYLGKDFKVLASYGHVRDLPPKDGSVRPDEGFAMDWELYRDKQKRFKEISDAAKGADRLVLATDPDREGEAISWHVLELLKKRKTLPDSVDRVTFNAITKQAVTEAMKAPRELDQPLIDAYLARRALDYLYGFTLSPVLWRRLPGAKSAGRVQSVALRLIVDREIEIERFRADEYWSVIAKLQQDGSEFDARLVKYQGKKLDKLTLGDEGSAKAAKAAVEAANFTIEEIETKPFKRNPAPPFTTSTLQQEAARKLGFSASHTMRLAQSLYEAGAITYMRTDGVQMDGSAISECRKAVSDRYGGHALPEKPRIYQSKAKNAQEAHEAIRPTDFSRDRVASGDEGKLYDLVYKRAMASQMAAAQLERTTVTLRDPTGQHELRATGQVVKYPGFLAVYQEGRDDADDDEDGLLPAMSKGDSPLKRGVDANQHFTQPPPRFSEASLVKRLEELGIGRPSTYASTIQTLRDRAYVRMEKNRFFAEESGRLLTAFLERFFPQYVAFDYTAGLEDELDTVSDGREDWKKLLEAFWRDFKPKTEEVMDKKPSEVTEVLDEFLSDYLFPERADGKDPRHCPLCETEGREGGRLALRGGRYGAFVACANYPDCKFTRQFAKPGGEGDDGADDGVMGEDPETGLPVERKSGRFGPYVQLGEGKEAKRASIPKDLDDFDLEWALKLLGLPRIVGQHPESGKDIEAAIGRYGPYLRHDGKYAKLQSTRDVFDTGMNAAVTLLAEAANRKGGGRGKAEPMKTLGEHPTSGGEMKVMPGRYGPYVTDGTTNATIPKDMKPEDVTEAQAIELIDARAAKGPAKKKKAAPKKKAPAKKKPAAKKASAKKKAPTKKTAAKKAAAD